MNKKQQNLLLPYGPRAVSGCDHEKFVGVTQHQSLITRKNVVWHFLELGQRSAILYIHTCKSCQKMYTKWPIILMILGEDSICVPFFFLIRFLPFNEYYVAIEIQYSSNKFSCFLSFNLLLYVSVKRIKITVQS